LILLAGAYSLSLAIKHIGPYPPPASIPTLIGIVMAVFFGGVVVLLRTEGAGHVQTLAVLILCALLLPLALAWWAPGVMPLKVYPIPGAPTFAISADPYGQHDLWLIHGDAPNSYTQLTNTKNAEEHSPDLSPDGRQVVYVSDASGDDDLWLMTLDATGRSTGSRQLTSGYSSDREPHWSPDGTRIVFFRETNTARWIATYAVASGVLTRLTPVDGWAFDPVWSPDGQEIAYSWTTPEGDTSIWVMNSNGTNPHQVVDVSGSAYGSVFSPDGKLFIFTAKSASGGTDAFIANVDGSDVRDITLGSLARDEGGFGWTPIGLPIIWSDRDNDQDEGFLYVCNMDGSGCKLVVRL
jgi:Tol biopolymer transport system component